MTTTEAIRLLRAQMGLSQQAFSNRLGISLHGVQNYEAGRIPDPKRLYALLQLAIKFKRPEIAEVFRAEARRMLGADPNKRLTI
jgi:transcriptional regulator with XRE-family HTH domain